MRSTSFAVAVLGCTIAFASAQEDCTQFNGTTEASEVTEECGGFSDLDPAAAVELSSLVCSGAVTAQDWANEFTTCAAAAFQAGYTVSAVDQSPMCGCYKKFVQFGFKNDCQEPPIIRALALEGFRFGVGQPLFSQIDSLLKDAQPKCSLDGLDASTGVYTGVGNLLTAAVSNLPKLNTAQGCVPACATICEWEECAPASSITLGSAALAMVFVAVASLMQ